MVNIPTGAKKATGKRKLELRDKLWPGIDGVHIWDRSRDGYGSVPRALPLIITIMNYLSDTGKPVGGTYLELFCRLRDEGFIVCQIMLGIGTRENIIRRNVTLS